jgi:hypothetical protein
LSDGGGVVLLLVMGFLKIFGLIKKWWKKSRIEHRHSLFPILIDYRALIFFNWILMIEKKCIYQLNYKLKEECYVRT